MNEASPERKRTPVPGKMQVNMETSLTESLVCICDSHYHAWFPLLAHHEGYLWTNTFGFLHAFPILCSCCLLHCELHQSQMDITSLVCTGTPCSGARKDHFKGKKIPQMDNLDGVCVNSFKSARVATTMEKNNCGCKGIFQIRPVDENIRYIIYAPPCNSNDGGEVKN